MTQPSKEYRARIKMNNVVVFEIMSKNNNIYGLEPTLSEPLEYVIAKIFYHALGGMSISRAIKEMTDEQAETFVRFLECEGFCVESYIYVWVLPAGIDEINKSFCDPTYEPILRQASLNFVRPTLNTFVIELIQHLLYNDTQIFANMFLPYVKTE